MRRSPQKPVGVAQKTPTTMEKKSGLSKKNEERFLLRERALPKTEPPTETTTNGTKKSRTTTVAAVAARAVPSTTTTATEDATATTATPAPS